MWHKNVIYIHTWLFRPVTYPSSPPFRGIHQRPTSHVLFSKILYHIWGVSKRQIIHGRLVHQSMNLSGVSGTVYAINKRNTSIQLFMSIPCFLCQALLTTYNVHYCQIKEAM